MEQSPRNLVWTLPLKVRWSDLDANGHVNNATYFTYFEQARVEWLHSLAAQTTAEGYGPVVKKTSCTYLRPIPHPATIEVKLYVGRPGRTSFPTYSEIWLVGEEPVKAAEGEAVMVWVHRASATPHPVPEFLRKLMP
jgi:acyl-CoA thioester hydrolase